MSLFLSSLYFRHMFSIFQSATRCSTLSGMLWCLRTALGSKVSSKKELKKQTPTILQCGARIQAFLKCKQMPTRAPLELQNYVKAAMKVHCSLVENVKILLSYFLYIINEYVSYCTYSSMIWNDKREPDIYRVGPTRVSKNSSGDERR